MEEWSKEEIQKRVETDDKKKIELFFSTLIHKTLQDHSLIYVLQDMIASIPSSEVETILKSGRHSGHVLFISLLFNQIRGSQQLRIFYS